jgi:hypothetical protein
MYGMDRIREAIKDFKEQNRKEYEKLLISEEFYEQLHKEATEKGSRSPMIKVSSTIIELPRMEIVHKADYDFKLI